MTSHKYLGWLATNSNLFVAITKVFKVCSQVTVVVGSAIMMASKI